MTEFEQKLSLIIRHNHGGHLSSTNNEQLIAEAKELHDIVIEEIKAAIKKWQDKAEKNYNEAIEKCEHSIELYWEGFRDGLSAILRELQ